MGETATLLTDEQIPIAPSIKAVHRSNATRVLGLYVRALTANGVSQTVIARETGREESAITRMLRGEYGMAADVEAAILAHDHLGIVAAGICALCGFEARKKTPDLAADNARLRGELADIREHLNRVLGDAP